MKSIQNPFCGFGALEYDFHQILFTTKIYLGVNYCKIRRLTDAVLQFREIDRD